MSEKDMFVQGWEKEFATTMKVLRAYPGSKLELKPASSSRSAKELAWALVGGEMLVDGILKGDINAGSPPAPPSSMDEIIRAYEQTHREMVPKVRKLADTEYQKPIKFITGPGTMGDIPRNQVLWFLLMDSIHHRGQFSVYLRMAGGKVPSIYGPSGDEPWM